MNQIEMAINNSTMAFQHYVWPIIKPYIGGGVIIPVEGVNNTMASQLDQISGIDFWQVVKNQEGVRGIASRVQPTGIAYNTFTIRREVKSGAETEFHKRVRAIFSEDRGLLFPTITIQAYMGKHYEPPVLSVGVIRTKDLYLHLLLNYESWDVTSVQGGNKMMVLQWDRLQNKGAHLRIVQPVKTEGVCYGLV